MARTAKTNEVTTPSVLSFERRIDTSYGVFTQINSKEPHQEAKPISVREKSVRGTISNRLSSKLAGDPLKADAAVENANLQTIDSASLSHDCDTLVVSWSCRVLHFTGEPNTCNNPMFQGIVEDMVEKWQQGKGLRDLSWRYAFNIASGRWLWRNRLGADSVKIEVSRGDECVVFDATDVDPNDFEGWKDKGIDTLTDWIVEGLCGKKPVIIDVKGFVRMGYGQDVYPSQELILKEQKTGDKNGKRKFLYQPEGIAAFHSQKIGNAIRTIDTWYEDEGAIYPIPAEVYGSVTRRGHAFRHSRTKKDFYTLFDNWSLHGEEPAEGDANYVMAVLIRGGVFGAADRGK